MNYRDAYVELFRNQTKMIKELEILVERMKLGQRTTEEMIVSNGGKEPEQIAECVTIKNPLQT